MNGKRISYLIAGLAFSVLAGLMGYGLSRLRSLEQRVGASASIGESQLADLGRDLKGIREQLLAVSKAVEDDGRLTGVGRDLKDVREKVLAIESRMSALAGLIDEPKAEDEIRFATLAQAEGPIKRLGEAPSARNLAEAIAAMEGLIPKADQEEAFKKLKVDQESRLRRLVKAEVQAHYEAALRASSGSQAAQELAEAARTLSLYPQSDERSVLQEARQLAAEHAETAGRIEVIRRQRYNKWAAEQIEKALDFYNVNVSRWNPLNDNSILIGSLVNNLGEVDPAALEPAVLELYNYVIDRTKGSISEKNKFDLAKRLTDPSVRRKALGDF